MAQKRRIGFIHSLRLLLTGMFSRAVRRTFFRSAFLLFILLIVLPFVLINVFANRATGNWLLSKAADEIFNRSIANVTWDESRTTVTGPGLSLAGTVTYYDISVER